MVQLCLGSKEVAGIVFNGVDTAYMYTGGQVKLKGALTYFLPHHKKASVNNIFKYSTVDFFFGQSEQILGDIDAWKGATLMATKVSQL